MVVAVPCRTKSEQDVTAAIEEAILTMEINWALPIIKPIHTDRESAVLASKKIWSHRAISITTTTGHDPQANGLAERYIAIVPQRARQYLAHIDDKPL